jgi:hypothetical protein
MTDIEKITRLYWAGCLAYIMWCEAAFRVLSQDADI